MSARVACWFCYILERLSLTHNQTVTNDFSVILLVIQLHLLLFSSDWTGNLNISKWSQTQSIRVIISLTCQLYCCAMERAVHLKWPYSGFEENVWDMLMHPQELQCTHLSPPLFRNNANIKSCCLRIQHSLLKAQNTSLFDLPLSTTTLSAIFELMEGSRTASWQFHANKQNQF